MANKQSGPQKTLRDTVAPVWSPETVARQRAMAEALLRPGQGGGQKITNWAEGLNALAEGFMGGRANRRSDAAEERGLAERSRALGNYLSQTQSAAPVTGGGFGMAALPASNGGGPVNVDGGNFGSLFAAKEAEYGLPPGYLGRAAQIESNNNPNAKNPNSSAGGLFQFIDSTAKQYGLANRFDPVQATDAAARLAADNGSYLRSRLGREPTAGELYLAHQQGAGGAAKLLSNPDGSAVSSVGGAAVRLNGGQGGMTNAQFASKWTGKFGSPVASYASVQTASAPEPLSATPAPANAPVQVASLDPSIGYDSALGQGAMRATGQTQAAPTYQPGAIAGDDSQMSPEDQARMASLRTPYNAANVQPYSGPGAIADAPGYIYDREGFRPAGTQPQANIAQPQTVQSGPQPYQISQGPAPYETRPQSLGSLLVGSAPAQQPSGNAAMIGEMLANPWTRDIGEQLALREMQRSPAETWETIQQPDGSVWQRSTQTGQLSQVAAAPKADDPYLTAGGAIYDTRTGQWMQPPTGPQKRNTTVVDGVVVDTDTGQPVYQSPNAGQPTTRFLSPAEIQQNGLDPAKPWQVDRDGKVSSPGGGGVNVTVNGNNGPDQDLLSTLGKKEGEAWAGYKESGTNSAGMMQDLDLMDELQKQAPQGPIQGRIAQAFPGLSSAGAAHTSLVNRIAPTLRAPGSGATSDIEYNGMLQSLPSLANYPEANAAISSMMRAKAQINVERSRVIDSVQNGEITVAQGRQQIAELNSRSIMTPQIEATFSGLGIDVRAPANAAEPPAGSGLSSEEWQAMPPEDRELFQ